MSASWPLNVRIKGKNKIFLAKVYGTLNVGAIKKRRKTCVAQANAKVTFHTITTLSS